MTPCIDCGCPRAGSYDSWEERSEFMGFKAGVYRAMEMMGASNEYLISVANATTRDWVIFYLDCFIAHPISPDGSQAW